MTDSTVILIFGLAFGTFCGYGVGFIVGRAFERWFEQRERGGDV